MERPNTENCRGAFEVENFYEQPSLASEKMKRIEITVPKLFMNVEFNEEMFFELDLFSRDLCVNSMRNQVSDLKREKNTTFCS